MKNIKRYLKSLGITQKEFSEMLHLSRPTLDSYIAYYEENERLPKDNYQMVFDGIFRKPCTSKAEFIRKLSEYTSFLTTVSTSQSSDLEVAAVDVMSSLNKTVKNDLSKKTWNSDIYVFINLLISSYQKNDFFRYLAEYFLILNGYKQNSDITEEQKLYYSKFYTTFRDLVYNEASYSEEEYQSFVSRCEEFSAEKEKKKNESDRKLYEAFINQVNDLKRMGIDVSEEELLDMLLKSR